MSMCPLKPERLRIFSAFISSEGLMYELRNAMATDSISLRMISFETLNRSFSANGVRLDPLTSLRPFTVKRCLPRLIIKDDDVGECSANVDPHEEHWSENLWSDIEATSWRWRYL